MVLGIPIAKLVPELFKAMTKPMVNGLKRNVRKSPFWKDRVFIPMAQHYNKASVRVRLWNQGIHRNKEQVERSARMSEEAALELGAEIVANTTTFIIGLMAILMQQSIASATEKKKEFEENAESKRIESAILDIRRQVLDLGLTVEQLDARMREMNRTITAMKSYNQASTEVAANNGSDKVSIKVKHNSS
uniref:Optic atrophy 3 protein homolog n=1 Tax=Phallusia mammillata TaxID=59560 RepID=A0A6F9DNL1_9ASCI|nr:optic atrophy 3 protein homolog [Phallusia mammillata]